MYLLENCLVWQFVPEYIPAPNEIIFIITKTYYRVEIEDYNYKSY